MTRCKTVLTPMNSNEKLRTEDGLEAMDPKIFICLFQKFMCITHTCLDISSFVVGILSRFINKPSKHHFGVGKCILRYLARSLQHRLLYTYTIECKLGGYTDSDWDGSIEDFKSTSGMVFSIGSAFVSWNSMKQEITALSTTEAKYIVATTVACQCVWLRSFIADCGQAQKSASIIWCDNQSIITIAKNLTLHGRTKHIDLRYYFIWDLVVDEIVLLNCCITNKQHVDIITNALPTQKHEHLRASLGIALFHHGRALKLKTNVRVQKEHPLHETGHARLSFMCFRTPTS